MLLGKSAAWLHCDKVRLISMLSLSSGHSAPTTVTLKNQGLALQVYDFKYGRLFGIWHLGWKVAGLLQEIERNVLFCPFGSALKMAILQVRTCHLISDRWLVLAFMALSSMWTVCTQTNDVALWNSYWDDSTVAQSTVVKMAVFWHMDV